MNNLKLAASARMIANLYAAIEANPAVQAGLTDGNTIEVIYDTPEQLAGFLDSLYEITLPEAEPAYIHLSFRGNPNHTRDLSQVDGQIHTRIEGMLFTSQRELSDELHQIATRLGDLTDNANGLLRGQDLSDLRDYSDLIGLVSREYQESTVPVLGLFEPGNSVVVNGKTHGTVIGVHEDKVVVQLAENHIEEFTPEKLQNVFEAGSVGYVAALTPEQAQRLADNGQVEFYPDTEPGAYMNLKIKQVKA